MATKAQLRALKKANAARRRKTRKSRRRTVKKVVRKMARRRSRRSSRKGGSRRKKTFAIRALDIAAVGTLATQMGLVQAGKTLIGSPNAAGAQSAIGMVFNESKKNVVPIAVGGLLYGIVRSALPSRSVKVPGLPVRLGA